ncbi:hypothetical protein D3C87_1859370 [compost metagenome]
MGRSGLPVVSHTGRQATLLVRLGFEPGHDVRMERLLAVAPGFVVDPVGICRCQKSIPNTFGVQQVHRPLFLAQVVDAGHDGIGEQEAI